MSGQTNKWNTHTHTRAILGVFAKQKAFQIDIIQDAQLYTHTHSKKELEFNNQIQQQNTFSEHSPREISIRRDW